MNDRSVTVQITFTPIDANGNSIGADIVHTHTFTNNTNTPQRETIKYNLPVGRYRCSVVRTSDSELKLNVSEQIYWTGLKFRLTAPTGSVYGNVTLVAVKMKATNGLSSQSSQQIRFKVTRKIPALGSGAPVATSNPVDVMIDILTSSYGGRRPVNDSELDLPELTLARNKFSGHNGFNAVFDRRITVWEAMTLSLQTVAAVPLPAGSQIGIAHDSVKQFRIAMFSDNNIVVSCTLLKCVTASVIRPYKRARKVGL